jgi:hypothetical protein
MSNGKGDTPRPISVSSTEYENNWERTFGTKKKKMQQRIQELQDDINKVRDMLDHYSGLPSTQSYDTTNGKADGNN